MTLTKARRPRLGLTWLALALGALALLAMPSLAVAKDRNHDRIPDRWEKRHKLSLKTNQARLDQDRDHLRNRAEFLSGDDPRDSDSDDDGVMDGDEQAGTISSFDAETGRLVIDLFGTDTIAGFVTDSTEIKCDDDSSASASASDSGSGSGEAEPGDDNGGHGEEEPGDDNGGDSSGPGSGDESGDDNSGPSDNSGPGSESSGPGHDGDDDHGEHGDDDRLCTTAELVPGAVVEEAELKLENGKATFREVELSGKVA
ncbi:MAG TPA: hypothetical protein VFS54_09310 [Solirubrobacterales bacterium]|nr:hypothetical protein [Solirubrobacterales bacterium]